MKDKIRERKDARVTTSLRFSLSMGSSLKIVCRAVRSSHMVKVCIYSQVSVLTKLSSRE